MELPKFGPINPNTVTVIFFTTQRSQIKVVFIIKLVIYFQFRWISQVNIHLTWSPSSRYLLFIMQVIENLVWIHSRLCAVKNCPVTGIDQLLDDGCKSNWWDVCTSIKVVISIFSTSCSRFTWVRPKFDPCPPPIHFYSTSKLYNRSDLSKTARYAFILQKSGNVYYSTTPT